MYQKIKTCVVRCQDNNMVNIASTFLGISHKDKIKHWNIKRKSTSRLIDLKQLNFTMIIWKVLK